MYTALLESFRNDNRSQVTSTVNVHEFCNNKKKKKKTAAPNRDIFVEENVDNSRKLAERDLDASRG